MRKPTRPGVGDYAEWEIEDAEGLYCVEGELLGYATSQSVEHSHPEGSRPIPKVRCAACRWFEIAIVDHDGLFVIGRANRSSVAGEDDWFTAVTEVGTAESLIEELTQTNERGVKYLSTTVKEALSLVAEFDDDVDALVNPQKPVRRL